MPTSCGIYNVLSLRKSGDPRLPREGGETSAFPSIALMLAVYWRLCELHNALREGRWLKFDVRLASYELHGKAVGIVGVGSVCAES